MKLPQLLTERQHHFHCHPWQSVEQCVSGHAGGCGLRDCARGSFPHDCVRVHDLWSKICIVWLNILLIFGYHGRGTGQ